MGWWPRRPRTRLVAAAAVVGATLALGAGVAAASAGAVDPERSSTASTQWWWYFGLTPETLSDKLAANQARLTDIEVQSSGALTAIMVRNTGEYQRSWAWFQRLTAADAAMLVAFADARLVDLEPYATSEGLRFAGVLVKNTGPQAKQWWWYYGLSVEQVSAKLTENGARLVDLDAYTSGDSTKYAAVMIKNAGEDLRAWWWYFNVDQPTLTEKLKANGARLTDLEPTGAGKVNAIMEKAGGISWYWYFGVTASQLSDHAVKKGARLFDVEPMAGGKFAGVMLKP